MTQSKTRVSDKVELDEIVIEVFDNSGSTGYHWKVSERQGCQVDDVYAPPSSGRFGAAGTRRFDIKFSNASGHLKIDLMPPGEGRKPAEQIEITKSSS